MSVHSSPFSSKESVSPKISSTCSRTTPEQLLRMCIKASYSPCTSLIKCSVPLGRLRMAERLIISVNADCSVGNCLDSRRRCLKSCGLRSNATMKHLPMGLVKLINSVKRLSVCAAFVSILRQRLNCRLNGLVNRFSEGRCVGWVETTEAVFSDIYAWGRWRRWW